MEPVVASIPLDNGTGGFHLVILLPRAACDIHGPVRHCLAEYRLIVVWTNQWTEGREDGAAIRL